VWKLCLKREEWRNPSQGRQIVFKSKANERRPIGDAEFHHNSAAVRVYGSSGQAKASRDIEAGGPRNDIAQYGALAGAQTVEWAAVDRAGPRRSVNEQSRYGRAHVLIAGGHRLHREQQLRSQCSF